MRKDREKARATLLQRNVVEEQPNKVGRKVK